MLATKSDSIEIAYKELKRLSQDEEKRIEYEARQKAIRDYNHLMHHSKQEGIKEGIKEGRYKEKLETAKSFLNLGLKPEMIAKGTGLSIEEINQLQKDLNTSN